MSESRSTATSAHSARLGLGVSRMANAADQLLCRSDRLLEAAAHEQWSEVQQLSEEMAALGDTAHQSQVAERARALSFELHAPENVLSVRRKVVRLVGACGRMEGEREDAT